MWQCVTYYNAILLFPQSGQHFHISLIIIRNFSSRSDPSPNIRYSCVTFCYTILGHPLKIPLHLPIYNLHNLHKYAPIYCIIQFSLNISLCLNNSFNVCRQGFSLIQVTLRKGYPSLPSARGELLPKHPEPSTGTNRQSLKWEEFISHHRVHDCHLIPSRTTLLHFISSNNVETIKYEATK